MFSPAPCLIDALHHLFPVGPQHEKRGGERESFLHTVTWLASNRNTPNRWEFLFQHSAGKWDNKMIFCSAPLSLSLFCSSSLSFRMNFHFFFFSSLSAAVMTDGKTTRRRNSWCLRLLWRRWLVVKSAELLSSDVLIENKTERSRAWQRSRL